MMVGPHGEQNFHCCWQLLLLVLSLVLLLELAFAAGVDGVVIAVVIRVVNDGTAA